MAIKTEMLRYFVEVVRVGHLTEAAANLGRTPSAVSMMLKQLEEHIGGTLFETDRKTRLTPLGAFVHQEACREVEHFDRMIKAISRYADSQEGLIRLASVPSLTTSLLPIAIKALHQKHPGLHVELSDTATRGVLALVENGSVDIGLVSASPEQVLGRYIVRPLLKDRLGILAPLNHPIRHHGRKVKWADLSDHDFIDNELSALLADVEVEKACAKSRLFAHNVSSLIAFVKNDMGITVLPSLACTALTDDLVFLMPSGPPMYRQISLVSRKGQHLSPAAETFRTLLEESSKGM